ncbi:hypothetical protein FLACHUCJ7_01270 [Flavobacterium chungangense]|uniref:DUF2931 domain-containing protein n=2 Tax=Flavobacterium chungangense TaxID=554283 RepID=A0A6V6YUJ1_9FLAO|nr:hypothetical protein FLACHUCJ7_01270 [Flavobacterium chungangense]
MLIIGKSNKEKFMRIVNFILLLGLFISCQSPKDKAREEEKFRWNAGISAPKFYPSAPFVEFLYQGKSVAGASTGAGNGWGITSGGFTGGDVFKPVPDSVFVRWKCGVDHLLYKGGFRLPRKKMLLLFNKGTKDPYTGQNEEYSTLVAGTAPGGNVTIWMKSGSIITEIIRFKAKNKGVYNEGSKEQQKIMDELYKSKEFINSETNVYQYFHGIPYKIWETGEKEYNYDIGFSTEEIDKQNIGMAITGYTKEGSLVYSTGDLQYIPWYGDYKFQDINLNKKLPVELFLQWISHDQQDWYQAKIVLPNNLDKKLLAFQKQYGNQTLLVVGMDKVKSDNVNSSFGRVWFQSPKNKTEIMRFRAAKLNTKTREFLVSQYSIPKDFIFPKWEKGKEPLNTPDVDYWQEQ